MRRSPWEPTWRRLAGTTVVLFAVILAFLAGRVRAGADPGLRSGATQTQTQTQPAQPDTTTPPESTSPPETASPPGSDDQTPSEPDFGDSDPPSTHVS
jgi:hypothetical protein